MNFARQFDHTIFSGFTELEQYFNTWPGSHGSGRFGLGFDNDGVQGYYGGMIMGSAFQPILCAKTGRPYAFEALLRATDGLGSTVAPWEAFQRAQSKEEVAYFDRLCRVTHTVNFVSQSGGEEFLFLNVDGRHFIGAETNHTGHTFTSLLSHCGADPSRIILEILEFPIDDTERLADAVTAYHKLGYRVALDDFGSRHSNYDRLWQLSPDIVKLDRTLLMHAESNPRARRVFYKIVETIHELDALVTCEGIETADQHALAVDAGVDLVQGYYFGRPLAHMPHLPMEV